jgi:hypothetical protein
LDSNLADHYGLIMHDGTEQVDRSLPKVVSTP